MNKCGVRFRWLTPPACVVPPCGLSRLLDSSERQDSGATGYFSVGFAAGEFVAELSR